MTVTNSDNDGLGSLRQTLAALQNGDIINFDLSRCPCTILLESELEVTANVTIQGLGVDQLILDGNDLTRVLLITTGTSYSVPNPGSVAVGSPLALFIRGIGGSTRTENALLLDPTVSISDLTIRNGNTAVNGSGIYNEGTLTLTDVYFFSNEATNRGGGIYNASSAILITEAVLFEGNEAGIFGGGLANIGNAQATHQHNI